jgi:hypothetical protein
MGDKVTEVHKTGDDGALLIMSEEGVIHPILADYLLVT